MHLLLHKKKKEKRKSTTSVLETGVISNLTLCIRLKEKAQGFWLRKIHLTLSSKESSLRSGIYIHKVQEMTTLDSIWLTMCF